LPDVDAFVGLDRLDLIADVARRAAAGAGGVYEVSPRAERLYEPPVPGVVFSTGCHAYVKIAEGCNHRCAFCAIPGIRGRHRSRTMTSLLREAGDLLDRGIRELVLVSQDVTAYGSDLGDGSNLAKLLRALGGFGGRYWIRWLYGYPTRVTDELLAAMAETSAVCRYFDLPIQHSHPEILRRMKRGATAPVVARLSERIRTAIPDATLRTTCLLGFPGETEEHVDHLVALVRRSEFDHLGAFVYSPEEGTPAAGFPDRPSRAVAERRRDRLMLAQKDVVDRRLAALAGAVEDVLLESPHPGRGRVWLGRSRRLAPEVDGQILVEKTLPVDQRGDIVPVRMTKPSGYDFRGVRVKGENCEAVRES
jgi:ribosomal protein S12 methylthiotransferase